MKTYQMFIKSKNFGYRYFYDKYIKLWTIFEIDRNGNQLGEPEYYNDRLQLVSQYPFLKFNRSTLV